ncbi:MAG: sugar ABC transporter permease [Sphaerochaetaceae bacterium]|nr:sugar ABC transporter permease [Sphaerochaetaceae bacterium]
MKQSVFPSKILPYLLLLPTFIILVIFLFYPAFETFRLSFYKVNPYTSANKFAGLYNFKKIFSNSDYGHSFGISIIFSLLVVCLGLIISLALAVLLNQKFKGAKIYRTLMIWPYALSPAIAGALFNFLFNPANGIVCFFTGNYKWMTQGFSAFIVVAIAATWKNLGYNIVFYLTALRNVPSDSLEAAAIDGARPSKRFFKITFAFISPTTFFLLVMNTTYAYFSSFGLIDVLTEGGPVDSTNILIYQLYKDFFVNSRIGYAAAESLVLFCIVVLITLVQFKTTGKKVYYQ